MADHSSPLLDSNAQDADPTDNHRWRVLVLSCDADLGGQVAEQLTGLERVSDILLLTAPWRTSAKPRSVLSTLKRSIKYDGWAGTARRVGQRFLGRGAGDMPTAAPVQSLQSIDKITCMSCNDFHDADAVAAMRAFTPDLGVLAGTYIIDSDVFELPAQGSINLHSGKVPDYRGSAPVFWELHNGESEVGLTVHRVSATLDGGHVLKRSAVPIDPTPSGDPLDYIERTRDERVTPAGITLLVETVNALTHDTVSDEPQDLSAGRTWPKPDHRAKRDLIKRVDERRRARQDAA